MVIGSLNYILTSRFFPYKISCSIVISEILILSLQYHVLFWECNSIIGAIKCQEKAASVSAGSICCWQLPVVPGAAARATALSSLTAAGQSIIKEIYNLGERAFYDRSACGINQYIYCKLSSVYKKKASELWVLDLSNDGWHLKSESCLAGSVLTQADAHRGSKGRRGKELERSR